MYSIPASTLTLLALSGLASFASGAALPVKVESVSHMRQAPTKLAPINFQLPGSVSKRDPKEDFRLRDHESFYYGHDKRNPTANVTGEFQGEHEHVINMDRFVGKLSNVDCRDPDLMMDFKEAEDFENAKASWAWVNKHTKNKFLMVANYPGCSKVNDRQPFHVSKMTFDNKKNKIFLAARQVDWELAMPKWSVHAKTNGLLPQPAGVSRRWSVDKSFSPSIAQDFSSELVSTTVYGVDLSLNCDPCGTDGNMDIEVKASGGVTSLDEASVTVTPSSVSAMLTLGLHASGTLTQGWETNIPIVDVPLPGGFEVPFVKIGPQLAVNVGASMSDWEGQATASYGATMNIPDDSSLTIDFKNSDNSDFSGWAPTFEPNGPTLDASITATAEVYAGASIEIDAEIFSKGFSAGVLMKAPDLNAAFTADVGNSGGACDGNDAGIDIDVNLGMGIAATAGLSGEDPFFSTDLYSTGVELFTTCIGAGGGSPTVSPTPTSAPNGTEARVRRSLNGF